MRKSIVAMFVAVLSLLGIAVLSAPSASASTITEYYACAQKPDGAGGVHFWHCDGTWWNASNYARTFQLIADPVTQGASDYRTVGVTYISSLDNTKKVVYWYCGYPNGTTSGLKATTQASGGLPSWYSWSGLGYSPCPSGTNGGAIGEVHGWVGGSAAIISRIEINTWVKPAGWQSGNPERTL